jgi:hypothetical protein
MENSTLFYEVRQAKKIFEQINEITPQEDQLLMGILVLSVQMGMLREAVKKLGIEGE